MLKDHNHDLIHQLSETSDSLWRIEDYIAASQGCDYCANIWKTIKADHEKHVKLLTDEIVRHAKEDRFE